MEERQNPRAILGNDGISARVRIRTTRRLHLGRFRPTHSTSNPKLSLVTIKPPTPKPRAQHRTSPTLQKAPYPTTPHRPRPPPRPAHKTNHPSIHHNPAPPRNNKPLPLPNPHTRHPRPPPKILRPRHRPPPPPRLFQPRRRADQYREVDPRGCRRWRRAGEGVGCYGGGEEGCCG